MLLRVLIDHSAGTGVAAWCECRGRGDVSAGAGANERSGGRERILVAARGEFAGRGFDGASTAEIARLAGVTQPLVHYHFASKEDLWKAVVLDVLGELDRFSASAAIGLDDLDEAARVRALMRSYVAFSAEHPEIGRLLMGEGARSGERLTWLVDEALGWRLRGLDALLASGVSAGVLKPLPTPLVGLAFLAAAGYPFQIPELLAAVHGLDAHDPSVIEAHADAMIEVFLHGILATDDRQAAGA